MQRCGLLFLVLMDTKYAATRAMKVVLLQVNGPCPAILMGNNVTASDWNDRVSKAPPQAWMTTTGSKKAVLPQVKQDNVKVEVSETPLEVYFHFVVFLFHHSMHSGRRKDGGIRSGFSICSRHGVFIRSRCKQPGTTPAQCV